MVVIDGREIGPNRDRWLYSAIVRAALAAQG
jgi:hypothetical protein